MIMLTIMLATKHAHNDMVPCLPKTHPQSKTSLGWQRLHHGPEDIAYWDMAVTVCDFGPKSHVSICATSCVSRLSVFDTSRKIKPIHRQLCKMNVRKKMFTILTWNGYSNCVHLNVLPCVSKIKICDHMTWEQVSTWSKDTHQIANVQ